MAYTHDWNDYNESYDLSIMFKTKNCNRWLKEFKINNKTLKKLKLFSYESLI